MRSDLSHGYQATMATHAAIEFAVRFPDQAQAWESASNSLVLLTVPTEEDLLCMADRLHWNSISYALFVEPDIDNEHTALAAILTNEQAKFCRKFPLALADHNDPRWLRESALRHSLTSLQKGGDA